MRSVGHALAVTVAVGLLVSPVIAQDATPNPDLLPGVDLVTEEVEPGVYRVVSDGVRHLKRVADRDDLYIGGILDRDIASGLDGSVWWFGPDGFFRLGNEDTYAWSESDVVDGVWSGARLGVTPDGRPLIFGAGERNATVSDPEHAAVFDGSSWTWQDVEPTTPAIWLRGDGLHFYDGDRWKILATPFSTDTINLAAVGADGTIWIRAGIGEDFTLLSRYGLNGAEPPFREWQGFSRGLPLIGGHYQGFHLFEVAPDGSVWFNPLGDYERTGTDCDGIANFDGTAVTYFLRDTCIYAVDAAPDGRIWLQAGERGGGSAGPLYATTIHTYVITPDAMAAAE